MLSYYPPMSGEGDSARPSGVMLCDVDKAGNLYNCRPYGGPSMHGDDAPNPNTLICNVDSHGNLVNCRPYYPSSSHGWEFDGSSGFGGGRRSRHGWEFDGSSGFGAAGGGGHGAARSAARPVAPQAAASRQNVFVPPNTTREFSNTQRGSYGRMFERRGYGYAGLGLAPRPWNWDPYYPNEVYYPVDVDPNYDPDAFVDDDSDFGVDILSEARHMASAHKPLLAGATLAALGGYASGPLGALVGGAAGYFGGKALLK
jgi:hypothetical protein